jgi:aminoglycoside N3'-acetyltransferase
MYSVEELTKDVRNLGVMAGDTVMLHASVRDFGEVG